MSSAIDRLKKLTNRISSYELSRKTNLRVLEHLYNELDINSKVVEFDVLFDFKAINLSGVSLLADNLGEIQDGKYLQMIAIDYDKDALIKSKNISLGYYGRSENVDVVLKDKIVEFVLRYRFEKSFMTLEHYNNMLESFKNG